MRVEAHRPIATHRASRSRAGLLEPHAFGHERTTRTQWTDLVRSLHRSPRQNGTPGSGRFWFNKPTGTTEPTMMMGSRRNRRATRRTRGLVRVANVVFASLSMLLVAGPGGADSIAPSDAAVPSSVGASRDRAGPSVLRAPAIEAARSRVTRVRVKRKKAAHAGSQSGLPSEARAAPRANPYR